MSSAVSFAHGRICLTNNAAERALRGGRARGDEESRITTAKLNDVNPAPRSPASPVTQRPRLHESLPWNWSKVAARLAA